LFVKGNIIGRKKKDYKDALKLDRLEDLVRELMQDQHKGMLRELKGGNYDGYLGLAEGKPAAPAPPAAAPPPPGQPAAPPPDVTAQAATPPPPPPASPGEQITEKPATMTINLSEDTELKDEDIFGSDLISDKSLDEVILSFLSEQMDEDDN